MSYVGGEGEGGKGNGDGIWDAQVVCRQLISGMWEERERVGRGMGTDM